MDYNSHKLIPYIPSNGHDKVAHEFLEQFYPDTLKILCPFQLRRFQKHVLVWMPNIFVYQKNWIFMG